MSKINKISVNNVEYDIEDASALKEVPSEYKTKAENDELYQAKGSYLTQETDPVFTASPANGITSQDITNWNNKSDFSGSYNDLSNKPSIPSKTSDLNNDSGFITKDVNNLTNYYKSSETYTKTEVDNKVSSVYKYKGTVSTYGDLPSTSLTVGDVYNVETADPTHSISAGDNVAWNGTVWDKLSGNVDLSGYQTKIDSTHKLSSDLVDDTNNTHLFVTSSEKTTWNGKQDTLVSGTNIKTINSTSILGSGDITTEQVQYSTMPTASATNLGQIVQYIGATDSTYTQGHFYTCVSDGQTVPTYSWQNIDVQSHQSLNNYLAKDNSTLFTPTVGSYQPATAKYAEDTASAKVVADKLTGTSAPTTSTVGYVGQQYTDTTNNNQYVCTAVDTVTPEYTWIQVNGGGSGGSTAPILITGALTAEKLQAAYDEFKNNGYYMSRPIYRINTQSSGYNELFQCYFYRTGGTYYYEVSIRPSESDYLNPSKTPVKFNGCLYQLSINSSGTITGLGNGGTFNRYLATPFDSFNSYYSALTINNQTSYTPTGDYHPSTKLYTDKTHYENMAGYDATKTQTLKNINGVLTWVDD